MRKWGQHFLNSKGIQKKIVSACQLDKDDEVLEIGPGRGELTQHYIDNVRRAVLVEIDPALAEKLKVRWGNLKHVEIVRGDFRELDPGSLGFSRPPVVLSDLPYYASKPVFRKILEWQEYKSAILTFQKEVALRITKDQCALSLITHLYASAKKLFDISPGSFTPPPKVLSSVIELLPTRATLKGIERENLVEFIHSAYRQPRKTLLNNINVSYKGSTKKQVLELLTRLGLPPKVRPHQIELPIFQLLSKSWYNNDDGKDL